MKRICGFALLFIAIGMIISLFFTNMVLFVFLIIGCLAIGYNLFCC